MTEERNYWFDIFKGFAILGVVAVHFAQQFPYEIHTELKNLFISGQYMVQMFFIISGYFAFCSYSKYVGNGVVFLKKKILSLIPVCYVAYAIRILYLLFIGQKIAPLDVICAFTFTNGISPHYINSIGGWYIGTLVVFYVITPILYKIISDKKRAEVFFFVSVLVCVISTEFLRNWFDIGWTFYFWLPRQLPVISLGIVLFYFVKERTESERIDKTSGGGIYV